MTELQILESARPEVRPLSDAERAALRTEIFGGTPARLHLEPVAADGRQIQIDLVSGTDPLRRRSPRSRRALSTAAALLVTAGLSGLWIASTARDPHDDPAAAEQPVQTVAVQTVPPWYDPIRSLLPDGFDQIVLTDALPEAVGFKAFRTGTRQLLDVSITLQPGVGIKDTTDAVTFTDEHGSYYESTSAVTLVTPDDRMVLVRCGLSPVGGGAVGSASMADSRRDYCGDSFDNLGLDPVSRRQLAARLAEAFSSEAVASGFGQPVAPTTEDPRVMQQLTAFRGTPVDFNGEQSRGVLRTANLSEGADGHDTELTIIHGIWPPRAADAVPANALAAGGASRFFHYDDVAVALVIADDGTGYHLITTDLTDSHLARLGDLLDVLVGASQASPAATDATAAATTAVTASTTAAIAGTALAAALEPDGTVLVVNASQTDGIAVSLSNALEQSGYDVVAPTSATGGVLLSQSAIYFHPDRVTAAVNAITNAVPIPFGEDLHGQLIPGLDDAMLASADIIVVLGDDLAGAPWEKEGTQLIDQGIGTLLVVDATTTAAGHDRAEQRAQQLRADGVDVADVVKSTRPVEASMLMPTGESTPWAFAVAALAGIGGFDTWDATLVAAPLPAGVVAVLLIADE